MPGEWYLVSAGTVAGRCLDVAWTEPRLILTKNPETTIESVYGKPLSELKPPDGWVFTGEFRTPTYGEYYLANLSFRPMFAYGDEVIKRLILRRPRKWVLTETGELRKLNGGEFYVSLTQGRPSQQGGNPHPTHEVSILRLEEVK